MYKIIITILIALWCTLPDSLAQEERILNYDVVIKVNTDRSIHVKEDITVLAQGKQIKRGITRGFPLSSNKGRNISYDIQKVLKNGDIEPYHTRHTGNYLTLYIGEKDVLLEPNEYHYTIEYESPYQIHELENVDEIYWNALGTQIEFPIDQASCVIQLPTDGNVLQQSCYTGQRGATSNKCSVETSQKGNVILFQTNEPLNPKEGLTVAVGFEKGLVKPITLFDKFRTAFILGSVALGLLLYYLLTWLRYGVDPPRPTAYPRFTAPHGYSPSSIAFIEKEKFHSSLITAAIIGLGTKGFLRMDSEPKENDASKNIYHLQQLKTDYTNLYPEEKILMRDLFENSDKITIHGNYQSKLNKVYHNFKKSIDKQNEELIRKGDKKNRKFIIVPFLVTIVAIIASVLNLAIYPPPPNNVNAFGVLGLDWNMIALMVFPLFAMISIFWYGYLIKRPSKEKLQLQSEIKGFKMYLEDMGDDRINMLNAPDRTPHHFERMLPYAYALGVANQWADLFKGVLDKAAYKPHWTNNRKLYHDNSYFGKTFMKTAVRPRTSSSSSRSSFGGSSGGGSSGGGGGGGSVGGW